VVGYDNSLFSPNINPKLTTVNFPTIGMGTEATKKVISLIQKTDYSMQLKLILELIIRDSIKKIN
jgi:DNA-binding LacI/PurR family transcriptional regulator